MAFSRLVVLLSLAALSRPAAAQSGAFERGGFSMGLQGGRMYQAGTSRLEESLANGAVENLQFLYYPLRGLAFGVEAGLFRLPSNNRLDDTSLLNGLPAQERALKAQGWTASFLGRINILDGAWSPYLLAGIGFHTIVLKEDYLQPAGAWASESLSLHGVLLTGGFGLEAFVYRNTSLSVEARTQHFRLSTSRFDAGYIETASGLVGVRRQFGGEGPVSISMLFDVMPNNFLVSPGLDGFSLSTPYCDAWWGISCTDTAASRLSYSPTMKIGIGQNLAAMRLDLSGGVGYIVNGPLHGPLYLGDAALRFKLGRLLSVGPHVSIVRFEPKWAGHYSNENDVKIEKGTGAMPGVVFSVGRTAAFQASVDYLAMKPLKLTTYNGWVANKKKLDFSGLMVQLGIAFRFFRSND
ncbi:MAG: hypothetical protein HY922_00445 [Elusimicrobia bacterium]|nr:hypothetical protein [Elusimicrobiota bacterium]